MNSTVKTSVAELPLGEAVAVSLSVIVVPTRFASSVSITISGEF